MRSCEIDTTIGRGKIDLTLPEKGGNQQKKACIGGFIASRPVKLRTNIEVNEANRGTYGGGKGQRALNV